MNNEYIGLAERMRESLEDLERAVHRAEELRDKALRTGDDGYWDGAALNLHGFYAGVEHILEDIAQVMEGGLPSGSEWHRRLLVQMTEVMPGTPRPSSPLILFAVWIIISAFGTLSAMSTLSTCARPVCKNWSPDCARV